MNHRSRACLLALLCLLTVSVTVTGSEVGPADASYRIPVTGVRAELGAIRQLTRVQGAIEAINAPEIMCKVAAEVMEVGADEGDRVRAGQMLARLDDEGFRLDKEAASSDISRLQALLENQLNTLKRDQSLTQQKLISEAQLDDSRAAVDQTRALLAHARSLLDKAHYQLSHTQVLAPINGVVQRRSVSLGDYVNPNSPTSKALFQVVDTDHLRARLYFPENLARRVTLGMEVELIKEERRVRTRIAHLRPMLEPGNRALHALADFDNSEGWKPGESITASVLLAEHTQAVTIPEAALVQRPAGLVVYRLEDGKARAVVVTTGIRENDRVEVLTGLAAGDLLALDGASYLNDGASVEIKGEVR